MFGRELDAAALVGMSLSEHSFHTWDIAVALEPAAGLSPDAAALLINTVAPLVGRAGKPQGKRFTLWVHTRDPERVYTLRVGEKVELTEGADGQVDGELVGYSPPATDN